MDRAPSRSGIVWKTTLILIPIATLAVLLWVRNVEVTALNEAYLLTARCRFFSLRIKTDIFGSRSYPVKFGLQILSTQSTMIGPRMSE